MKKRIIIGLCVAVLLSGAAWWSIKTEHVRVPVSMLLQPPEMAAAQYSNKDVVGDLGGVPVTIPRHFAEYVEYDGDPGFGKKREGSVPVRTHKSKLRSFGFDVRYPDMAGISTPELVEEKRKENFYKTMWLDVGITSGEFYPGDGFLDRFSQNRLNRKSTTIKHETYEKLPELQFGLEVYTPVGIDAKTSIPHRDHPDAKDIYIARDESGKVKTIIICGNRPIKSITCNHRISMEPEIKIGIDIKYRRDLLAEWKEIQASVIKVVGEFQVKQ